MSQQAIRERAAEVRRTWTRAELSQRATASNLRCIDLVIRLASGSQPRTPNWHAKTSA